MSESIWSDQWYENWKQEQINSRKEELVSFYERYLGNKEDAELFIVEIYTKTTRDNNVCLRMMNNIKRFATIMDDDVKNKIEVKLFFLLTCIESLYILVNNNSRLNKRDILEDFLDKHLLETDKHKIIEGIKHSIDDDCLCLTEITDLLCELRNKLVHEGVYGYFTFGDGKGSFLNCINLYVNEEYKEAKKEAKEIKKQTGIVIDLDEYKKNEKFMRTYDVSLTFEELRDILIRGMINFLKQYLIQ